MTDFAMGVHRSSIVRLDEMDGYLMVTVHSVGDGYPCHEDDCCNHPDLRRLDGPAMAVGQHLDRTVIDGVHVNYSDSHGLRDRSYPAVLHLVLRVDRLDDDRLVMNYVDHDLGHGLDRVANVIDLC